MAYYTMERGWMNHYVFKQEKFTEREAWIYLIEHAQFKASKFRHKNKVYEIQRGDTATSYRALARAFQWSVNRTQRFLKLLQSESMIKLKTEHGFVYITICNYGKYQPTANANETVTEQQRDTDGTATDTNINNDNKGNKGKEREYMGVAHAISPVDSNMMFQEVLKVWIDCGGGQRADRTKSFEVFSQHELLDGSRCFNHKEDIINAIKLFHDNSEDWKQGVRTTLSNFLKEEYWRTPPEDTKTNEPF